MINVTKSSMPPLEEYIAEIRELWDTHWLTNMGIKHQEFQRQLEQFCGNSYVSLFTNGHLALENAIAAMQLPQGSEVITTPYTFASTTQAIVRNGLIPVFCDIDETDYTIDADKIEALITDKTSAIVAVHVYGNICNVEQIDAIAQKHHLKVIYDAAHAFAVEYNGKNVANFGDASMFSFHATKVFHTIEGGAVCVRDQSLLQRMEAMKNFGLEQDDCQYVGGNAKMNEFQAAMGICNLRHLEQEIQNRKSVFDMYMERLEGIKGIHLNLPQKNTKSNYAYFPLLFDGYKYTRDEVCEKLKQNGIFARKYFYPITNSFTCYKDFATANPLQTPIAMYVSERILTLPLYPDLEEDAIDLICQTIVQ